MNTLPGVRITTEVISANPKGNSPNIVALVGASEKADMSGVAQPYKFDTYSDAASALGTSTTNGRLIDMVKSAFDNNASEVVVSVASITGSGSPAEYVIALEALRSRDDLSAIAVEDTTAPVATSTEVVIDFMANEYKYIRGYVGLPTSSNIAAYTDRASLLDNDRMFVSGPNYKDIDGNELPGGITSAINAMIAENEIDPAQPITYTPAQGVDGIGLTLFNADYDTLHNGGVYTTQQKNTVTRVARYLTTATGTDEIREGTISKSRDFVAISLKNLLEGRFVGQKLVDSTIADMDAEVNKRMKELQDEAIVSPDQDFSVIVKKTPNTNDSVDVIVNYYAVYPLNSINLNLTINI